MISLKNENQQIPVDVFNDQYRYEVVGLNGVDISSFVKLINNKIHITKTMELSRYDFVFNKVHKDLNVIVEQIFYKVANV